VRDVPISNPANTAPAVPLREGQINPNVELLQIRLNRISRNYPAIPKIYPTDGVFGPSTTEAVKKFQEVFGLSPDGIVGSGTLYRVLYIYNGIKRLSELNSEGLTLGEISTQYPYTLSLGSTGTGVLVLQYYLTYISRFIPTIPAVAIDGNFGSETQNAVTAFQRTYSLPEDGIVGELTWQRIYDVYRGLVASLPTGYTEGTLIPFGGEALTLGSEGEQVRLLQEYLNYVAEAYPEIPRVAVDGVYGPSTQNAVTAFQDVFAVPGGRGVVTAVTWNAVLSVYDDLYNGRRAAEGQYPGYTVN